MCGYCLSPLLWGSEDYHCQLGFTIPVTVTITDSLTITAGFTIAEALIISSAVTIPSTGESLVRVTVFGGASLGVVIFETCNTA